MQMGCRTLLQHTSAAYWRIPTGPRRIARSSVVASRIAAWLAAMASGRVKVRGAFTSREGKGRLLEARY